MTATPLVKRRTGSALPWLLWPFVALLGFVTECNEANGRCAIEVGTFVPAFVIGSEVQLPLTCWPIGSIHDVVGSGPSPKLPSFPDGLGILLNLMIALVPVGLVVRAPHQPVFGLLLLAIVAIDWLGWFVVVPGALLHVSRWPYWAALTAVAAGAGLARARGRAEPPSAT